MRRYVIATHGRMASGMRSTLELIIGEQKDLICLDAYTEDCQDPMQKFQNIIRKYSGDEIVIMTDLFGGSVNNNAVTLMGNPNVHVVTGINLALAISILLSDSNDDIRTVIVNEIQNAREMMLYCNEQQIDLDLDDDF